MVTGVAVMHAELLHGELTCRRSFSHTRKHKHAGVKTHTRSPDGRHTGSVHQSPGCYCEGIKGGGRRQLVICSRASDQAELSH